MQEDKVMQISDAKEIVDELTVEFAWRMDHGQAPQALELFCEELQFSVAGNMQDRDDLAKQLGARAGANFDARHIFTNRRIVSCNDAGIEATVTTTIHKVEAGDDGPSTTILCADYNMRLQREKDQWRFKSIEVTPLVAPAA